MTYDHTIKPTTINILGSSPRTATPSRSPYKFDMEEGPTCRQSLWQWVKSGVKKACRYVHQENI